MDILTTIKASAQLCSSLVGGQKSERTTLGLALYGQKEDQPGSRALLCSGHGVTFFKTRFRLHY